jgi:2-dehydro-3-deoxygluconokinase
MTVQGEKEGGMLDVVTFGEAMIRLSPPHFQRIEQTRTLDVEIGGAELNVAVGVSRLGGKSAWVSRLPRNPLGRLIGQRARELGVDCSHVLWSDEGRAGLYFFEFGASPRPPSVLYDRAGSSVSMIRPGEANWGEIFSRAHHFHVTGITPALSGSAAQTTLEALRAAKRAGCTVSYDINYRQKLWPPDEAGRVQKPMMEYVDLLITNAYDPQAVFGLHEKEAETLAERLAESFGFSVVAVTLKSSGSAWRDSLSAMVWAEGRVIRDRSYEVEIVDRLGSGDSFAAGFLTGWLEGGDAERGLRYGNAFAALKQTFPGDFNWATREEVEALLGGETLKISR